MIGVDRSGEVARPPMRLARPQLGRLLLRAYGGFGFLFLYLPIFFLVLFSFNDNIIPSLPFRGFTLQWYRDLQADFLMQNALYNSLFIATVTTFVSTALGTVAAFPLVRCGFRFKRSAEILVILPMIIPHFLIGVAMLIFFSFAQIHLSRLTIILGHIVVTLPFAVLVISARLHGFDRTLERAAADLGATPLRTYRYVMLPLLLPGIIGAAMLVFTLSIDEFLITYFLSGQKGTLTMYIWSLLKDGIAPRVNALASLFLAASFLLLLLGSWIANRSGGVRGGR